MFRHASLPLIFFPTVALSLFLGRYWPGVYAGGCIVIYLVLDRFSYRSVPEISDPFNWISGFWLLLQIPLSVLLILLLFARMDVAIFGVPLIRDDINLRLQSLEGKIEILFASGVVGFHLSTNFVVAHELMHRRGKLWKTCSRFLLMMVGDAHFQEAHIYGHHANVGTSQDPATARRGESLYHFLICSTVGQWREAYSHECRRLSDKNILRRLTLNRVIRGNLGSLLFLGIVGWLFGIFAIICYVIVMVIAKTLLEAINYIQHYGLVRSKGVRANMSPSWESDGLGSSLILFNLTRHTQHHQDPRITWDKRQFFDQSLQIKGGYMLAILVSFIPRLWFNSVDPILDRFNEMKKSSEYANEVGTERITS
jgi:alkane 1-monooxygenase